MIMCCIPVALSKVPGRTRRRVAVGERRGVRRRQRARLARRRAQVARGLAHRPQGLLNRTARAAHTWYLLYYTGADSGRA